MRKRVVLGVATFLIATISCVLILEGGLRVHERWRAAHPPPPPDPLPILQPNPRGTGSYRLRPNLDLVTRVGNRTIRVRTNSRAMAWREVSIAKTPGVKRVAFLGDSFTFGCWADSVEQSFVGVFDRILAPRGYEALNFGVGGFGPVDEELLLDEEALAFEPDFVIVALYTGNDFRDTYLGLSRERIVDGTAVLDEDNVRARVPEDLRPDDNTLARECPESPVERVAKRFATYRALAPLVPWSPPCVEFRVNRNFTMLSFWSQRVLPPAAAAAKDEVLAIFGRMDRKLRDRGARLAVVAIPTKDQAFAKDQAGPGYDIALPQAYVEAFAREQGIPYLDLLPKIREHQQRTAEPLYWERDTHFNGRGHELAGQWIASWFEQAVARPR